VVVADDSAVVRAGVEAILGLGADVEVVGSASALPDLLEVVAGAFTVPGSADVVVTDIRMPPTGTDEGIAAAEQLRTTHPWVGVVVLSQHADPAYLGRLMAAGSGGRGYLLKDHVSDPGELATAVSAVASGGSYVDGEVAGLLVRRSAEQTGPGTASPMTGLTQREVEVLRAVATGRSNQAIGQMLFITHRAVEKHINSIFAKLGLHDDRDVNRRVSAVLAYLQVAGS
jgi:DNA-binding NarL/FixJ family response regulator